MRREEAWCPFCDAPLSETRAPVVVVLGLASLLAACSDDGLPPTAEGDGSSSAAMSNDTTDGNGDGFTVTSGGSATGETGAFETSAADSDDSTTDTNSGGGFIYGGGDTGSTVFECYLAANDCPEGQKCSPWANDGGPEWNATHCVPLDPDPQGEGDPCIDEGPGAPSGFDDCDVGLVCLTYDGGFYDGICTPLCALRPGTGCDDPTDLCVVVDSVAQLCLQPCDPAMPACQAPQSCVELGGENVCG